MKGEQTTMKKDSTFGTIVLVVGIILIVALLGFTFYTEHVRGNYSVVDMKYSFNYAVIDLGNGKTIEGTVTQWCDYNESDTVQVEIDGKTFLTHYSNIVLISEEP